MATFERAEEDGRETPPAIGLLPLFLLFLRFGALAFGGPAAQIAMIRRELVDERRWLSSERFNRLLAVIQVLPGPEAHELCVHLGVRARGRIGGLLAGLAFMLPGTALVLLLAWAYTQADLRAAGLFAAFAGAQAAVVALVIRAAHRIGEHALTDRALLGLALAAALATLAGASFWLVLPAAGLAYAVLGARAAAAVGGVAAAVSAAMIATGGLDAGGLASARPEAGVAGEGSAWLLFLSGLKAGLLTFGGAYTAIPFVRQDAAAGGWASDRAVLDGVAAANVLPAPLVVFATFVGYVAGGLPGALAITAGVFLPAFGFSLIFYERLEALTEARRLRRLLAGVAAAVVGLIGATAIGLAQSVAIESPALLVSTAVFAVVLAVLYLSRSRWAPVAVITAAAATGWLLLP